MLKVTAENYDSAATAPAGNGGESFAGNSTLHDAIFCQFKENISSLKLNKTTAIKGRVIGYDDLLE